MAKILHSFVVPFGVLFFVASVFSGNLQAISLTTEEEALADVFGADAKISIETKAVSDAKLARIKERLGGVVSYHRKGAQDQDAPLEKADFYVATKGGTKVGVALVNTEPGKWGPMEFMVALNLKGAVSKVLVLSYDEKRGRPISRASYLSQFTGKTSKSKLTVGDDIVAVSGATITSESSVFAVKKAIVLYEELYLE